LRFNGDLVRRDYPGAVVQVLSGDEVEAVLKSLMVAAANAAPFMTISPSLYANGDDLDMVLGDDNGVFGVVYDHRLAHTVTSRVSSAAPLSSRLTSPFGNSISRS
jgi:hypothetical protein